MEVDKENVNRLKPSTKIPLPMDPLPPLPKHLVEKNKVTSERYPLKTLNSQEYLELPGPSNRPKLTVLKSNVNVDDRHVTRRTGFDKLDWDYKVFKDDTKDDESIILVSDDEDLNKKKEYRFFVANRQRSCLGESKTAVTPAVKSLESNRIKKLKRSLKRPHSRELQGLSPVAKEQKKVDEKVRRKLHFNEPLLERLMSPDFLKKSYMRCHTRDYASDTFAYLLAVEQRGVTPRVSGSTRACVINWLMKVNGADGNPATVQTAIWYLDSVLATGFIQVDKLQLIAAACYWLASKLHGPGFCASRLVKCSKQAFTTEELLIAEKAILERLKFPSQPIVPQDFITYLAWRCDPSRPGEIEVAATFLCMTGLMVDKSLCNEYPSVIGAAAVRNVLLLLSRKDLLIPLQMCPIFKSADKKAANMSYTCSILRRAVRAIANPLYEYRTPFEQFGTPPYYIAQRIINSANELSILDARNTCRNN